MPRYRPIAVDLFSGAGGLSLGVEQAGFDVAVAVEWDPIHAMTHKFNFPDCAVLCRDVQALTGEELAAAVRRSRPSSSRRREPIALVVGGPSCQGFSPGGARLEDDARNQLLLEFVRLVTEIRPSAFILENVSGLLEPRFDELRSVAWKRLREAGYALSGTDRWLDAYDFGVPQRRKRVIVTGRLGGPALEIDVPAVHPRLTVGQAFEGLPQVESYEELLHGDTAVLTAADRIVRQGASSLYARLLSGLDIDLTDFSQPRIWDPLIVSSSLRARHTEQTVQRFAATQPGTAEPKSRLFRLDPARPSRTLRAGSAPERGSHTSPRPIHPSEPRAITVREAARLHGYPDWFRFNPTNWHGHRQVGNSVPPPLAKAVAVSVLRALGYRPQRRSSPIALGPDEWLKMTPQKAAAHLEARDEELPPQRTRN